MQSAAEWSLEFRGVSKSFGSHRVLDQLDLRVRPGEKVTLIGPSGSGKTTVLRLAMTLDQPSAGDIVVFGESIVQDPQGRPLAPAQQARLRGRCGMVFQQFNLFPHLTVGENVMLAPQVVKKTPRAEAEKIARQMLERVGLAEKFDAYPERLSGGQQQRVAIARALAMSPKVLLCDEITSALDPELVNEVLAVVKQLASEGMTLIMVTHEMRFAREVGNKLVFMHHGKVHEIGDPKALFAAPQTEELRNFIGSVNL